MFSGYPGQSSKQPQPTASLAFALFSLVFARHSVSTTGPLSRTALDHEMHLKEPSKPTMLRTPCPPLTGLLACLSKQTQGPKVTKLLSVHTVRCLTRPWFYSAQKYPVSWRTSQLPGGCEYPDCCGIATALPRSTRGPTIRRACRQDAIEKDASRYLTHTHTHTHTY